MKKIIKKTLYGIIYAIGICGMTAGFIFFGGYLIYGVHYCSGWYAFGRAIFGIFSICIGLMLSYAFGDSVLEKETGKK